MLDANARCPRCGGHDREELQKVVSVYRLSYDQGSGRTLKKLHLQTIDDEDMIEHKIVICMNERCNYETSNYEEWIERVSLKR